MKKFQGKRPMEQLKDSEGKETIVKLKDETFYKGTLVDIDGYMNVILRSATEFLDECAVAVYDEIYIRGDTILYVRLD